MVESRSKVDIMKPTPRVFCSLKANYSSKHLFTYTNTFEAALTASIASCNSNASAGTALNGWRLE